MDGKAVENWHLWLYFAGWGGMNRAAVGAVQQGVLNIQLDSSELQAARGANADKDWATAWADQLWVVLEVIPVEKSVRRIWLHTPQLANSYLGRPFFPNMPIARMRAALPNWIARLGKVGTNDARVVDIPGPIWRTIWLKNLDGSARANQQVYLKEFVSRSNHCGVSMDFDTLEQPFSLVSDVRGKIEFLAPLHELNLQTSYVLRRPTKRELWAINDSLRLSASKSQVFRQRWIGDASRTQLPGLVKKYVFTLLDAAGHAVPGLTVIARDAIDGCGISSHPVSVPSDHAGLATAALALPETDFIYLAKDMDAEEIYRLGEADIEILEATGTFTLRLPAKKL